MDIDDNLTPTPLPSGDLHFDGRTISVGGVPLGPGRYALGDTGSVLTVEKLEYLEEYTEADYDDV